MPLTLEREGELGHLVLDAPPRNELGLEALDSLAGLVDEVLPDLEVGGLVVSGRGRHFSSGSPVGELLAHVGRARDDASPPWRDAHAGCLQRLGRLPYPVVAAVGGLCLGSGLELALSCTARVAADNALLAFPETQHGLIPGCGGTVLLAELVGFRKAMALILGGELVDAAQALELGLVDRVVPRRELLPTARRLAACGLGVARTR